VSKKIVFPKNFIWGTASASYQIEGAVKEDGRGISIWDKFSHTPGRILNNQNGDVACDSYHKYKEDIKQLKWLGVDAYRFSVAWPRVIPNGTGKVNEKGLDYYERVVDELLKNGIKPFVTLYHWDLPQVLEDKGGWRKKDTSYAFADYSEVVVKRLSDRVKDWITLNEAPCCSYLGYKLGIHAPGARVSNKVYNQILFNLLLAHGLGLSVIRDFGGSTARAGIAHDIGTAAPATKSKADYEAAKKEWIRKNSIWLDPLFFGKFSKADLKLMGKDVPEYSNGEMLLISKPVDFFGINVYALEDRCHISAKKNGKVKKIPISLDAPKTSFFWEITPEALSYNIRFACEIYNPKEIFITENGVAFNDVILQDGRIHDSQRVDFFKSYLAEAAKIVKEGYPLKGYFEWSLLDNFEWAAGYTQRFGMIYTDYLTQKRIPKDSAYFYKKLIKENGYKFQPN